MKNVEKIKQDMKEAYAKKVDLYFSRFEEQREKNALDIDEIESLLGKGLADVQVVLLATSEKLLKIEADEQEDKKNVPILPKSVKAVG